MALSKPRVRCAKVAVATLTMATMTVALLPLVVRDLTILRFLGVLAGANFLAIQLAMLWLLRKGDPIRAGSLPYRPNSRTPITCKALPLDAECSCLTVSCNCHRRQVVEASAWAHWIRST